MSKIIIPWEGWELAQEKEIGRGGFGKVYDIKRVNYDYEEHAAMKLLHVPKNQEDIENLRFEGMDDVSIANTYHGYVKDMIREYQMMQTLRNCPNVVHVYDYKVKKSHDELLWTVYIRMELLTPIMKKPSCIQTEAQILQLAKDMCNALIDCHKRTILHLEIKPENIFIDPVEGNFKIGDFGISRVVEHTTHASVGVGTYDYMSPQVLLGDAYGMQADIYSLGMVLYYLLNQRRHPFLPLPPADITATMREEARRKKMRGIPLPPPANGCAAFKAVVLKACEFDPEDRYLTVQNMLDDLNRIVLDEKPDDKIEIDPIPDMIPDTETDNGQGGHHTGTDNGGVNIDDDITVIDGGSPIDTGNSTSGGSTSGADGDDGDDEDNGKGGKRRFLKIILNIALICITLFLAFTIFVAISSWIDIRKQVDKIEQQTSLMETARDLDVPLQTLEGEWENGSYQVNVYDTYYAEIKLEDELFINHKDRNDGVEGVAIRLYHDVQDNSYYNLGFIYQAGKLQGSAAYYVDGTISSDYEPSSFTFEEANGSVSANLIATNKLSATLLQIEDIQVIYLKPHTPSGPVTVYTTYEETVEESPTETTQPEFEPFPYESQGMMYVEEFDVWTMSNTEEIDAQRLLVDQWNDGGIRVYILDENRITVDLKSDFFTDPESQSKKSIIVQLYHNLNKNHCYNINFGYNGEELYGNAVYLKNGTMEYNYTPDIFNWSEEDGVVRFNLQANEDIPWNMFELEGIHVIYQTPDEAPEVALSYNVPKVSSKIQFIHIEGPDDKYGGDVTEKAVIQGINLAGKTIWTHETDVKFEIYQSHRIESIGYINDKYLYTDDDTLVILDAATGKVFKQVKNVGRSVTDILMDFDGTMYLCCYWGPHFVELSPDYKVVHKIDAFGGMCDWASDIYKEADSIYVSCEIGPMGREEEYIFKINLDDYSYELTNPATPIN